MIVTLTIRLSFLLMLMGILSCASSPGVFRETGPVRGQTGMNFFSEGLPGEKGPFPRPYESAPPLIPHVVTDYSISRSANDCLQCHLEGTVGEVGNNIATKVPQSHFLNEYMKQETSKRVAGMRYLCLQCHVPQAEKEPPVSQR